MLSTSTSTSSACSEGTSFSIASETLPGAEGCYLDTDYVNNNQAVYTTSGTIDVGQIWMIATTFIVDDSSTEVVSGRVHVAGTMDTHRRKSLL